MNNQIDVSTMTSDDQTGSVPSISSQEELAAALQKELGQAAGYLDLKYREWCIQHPDEVNFVCFIDCLCLYKKI